MSPPPRPCKQRHSSPAWSTIPETCVPRGAAHRSAVLTCRSGGYSCFLRVVCALTFRSHRDDKFSPWLDSSRRRHLSGLLSSALRAAAAARFPHSRRTSPRRLPPGSRSTRPGIRETDATASVHLRQPRKEGRKDLPRSEETTRVRRLRTGCWLTASSAEERT